MRRLVLTLLLGCAVSQLACREQPPAAPAPKPAALAPPAKPVLRLHFAGLSSLSTDPNNGKILALVNSPEGVALRKQVTDRLALVLADVVFGTNAASRSNRVALLRPLLDGLVDNRFYFELHDLVGPRWTLAVFAHEKSIARWNTNLWQAASSPTLMGSNVSGLSMWHSDLGSGAVPLGLTAIADTLVITTGTDAKPGLAQLEEVKSGKHLALSTNLLALTADLARLQSALDLPKAVAWPHLSLSVTAKGETLRSEATLTFANATPWQLAAFRLPTNSVRDPLISFTAVQGFGDWLARLPEFKEWELKSAPNQFFAWARSDVPYNLLAAAPMPDASNTVVRAAPHALHTLGTNIAKAGVGRIAFTTNRTELGWVGMPILVPFVRPAPEPGDDFLLFGSMAGIIPMGQNTNPPPAELLNQFLPRTNLVYYDWEITEAKLAQWLPIVQLATMLSPNPTFPSAVPANAWLRSVSPKLANTITEVTAVSPTELRAVRRSDLGLTAIELTWLARWLDNPAFPAFAYPTNTMPRMPALPGAK